MILPRGEGGTRARMRLASLFTGAPHAARHSRRRMVYSGVRQPRCRQWSKPFMANLVITRFCQRHCEYCFVPPGWRAPASEEDGAMTLDEFRQACDIVLRSGR